MVTALHPLPEEGTAEAFVVGVIFAGARLCNEEFAFGCAPWSHVEAAWDFVWWLRACEGAAYPPRTVTS